MKFPGGREARGERREGGRKKKRPLLDIVRFSGVFSCSRE